MSLEKIINDAWENKDQVNQNSDKSLKDAINEVISDLDSGKSRVAEKVNGEWITHQHLKKAIMLSFRIYPMENLNGPYSSWYDKAHLLKGKTAGWTKEDHEKAGFRMVPNSPVRKGSFVGKDAVLMPCYVNIGSYIGAKTMMDTLVVLVVVARLEKIAIYLLDQELEEYWNPLKHYQLSLKIMFSLELCPKLLRESLLRREAFFLWDATSGKVPKL